MPPRWRNWRRSLAQCSAVHPDQAARRSPHRAAAGFHPARQAKTADPNLGASRPSLIAQVRRSGSAPAGCPRSYDTSRRSRRPNPGLAGSTAQTPGNRRYVVATEGSTSGHEPNRPEHVVLYRSPTRNTLSTRDKIFGDLSVCSCLDCSRCVIGVCPRRACSAAVSCCRRAVGVLRAGLWREGGLSGR